LGDEGGPGGADRAWEDEVGPRFAEEEAIDDRLDVSGAAFPEHDLVDAEAVGPACKVERGRRAAPPKVDAGLDGPEGV
jgi:hypothetical protein